MFALLHSLRMFIIDLFKSPCRRRRHRVYCARCTPSRTAAASAAPHGHRRLHKKSTFCTKSPPLVELCAKPHRHPGTPDRTMAVGAARPAIRDREPAGCWHQYRHRGGRESAPDGYTLLLACLPNASNATLYENLKFNFIRDIAPIAGIARDPFVIEVNPS